MTSLVQHLTDPTQPQPDITHQEMLNTFTNRLLHDSFTEPALKGLYTRYTVKDGSVAIILDDELRTLLFSEISREHLERMLSLVFVDKIIFVDAIRAALDGSVPGPVIQGML